MGAEGEGFKIAMFALENGRYTVAAGATGLIRACRDASVKYAKERKTFGVAIGEHQLVKEMIAQMVSDYDAARLLWLRAGWLKNEGRRNTRETSLAKWFATVASERAAGDCVQIHGGNGYSDEYPVGRFYRNCKGAVIYEGTREIHKLMQADYVLGYRQDKPRRVELPAYKQIAGRSPKEHHRMNRDDLSARVPAGRRAGGHRRRAHHGPGRPQVRRPGGRRGDAQGDGHASTSTAPSSSARASATRRRCSSSARRWAQAAATPVDIAVDPLEGTNLCATGAPNAIAVLAASEKGGLLHAPDIYMEKLVVGPSSKGKVDLDAPVEDNLKAIAKCPRPRGRRPGGHRARPAAPREADRRHPQGRGAHPPDRRRRPLGRHHGRGRRARACTP